MIRSGSPSKAGAGRPSEPLPLTGFTPVLVLSMVFLAVLWIAGGASRPDVSGQAIVRGAAWLTLCIAALFAPRPMLEGRWPVALLLVLTVILPLAQLVQLPPSIWRALPGRALLDNAAVIVGEPQPWRPLSMVPDATVNAAASLVVPVAMFILLAAMREAERRWLPAILLGLIVASTLLALLQFSGSRFNNPLINDTIGQISASFANRNHLALFLAIGCVVAPVWAVQGSRGLQWRVITALGIIPLLILTILATGSRAGLLLCVLALAAAVALTWKDIRRQMRRYPRWVLSVLGTVVVSMIAVVILVAVVAGRAMSINRVLAGGMGEDMRSRALPTVMDMIGTYFPAGSGLGGFDPLFRIHEPRSLLKLTYFNHAHNDFLEVALDAGLAGMVLLLLAVGWWAFASLRAWRGGGDMIPRLGSVVVGLVLVASVFDYPGRTPMIMAVVVIAAWWLSSPALHRRTTLRN